MADIFDFHVYDDRSIQFVLAEPIMLEDKDVTQFRFRIPKSLNGFDMTSWEWWFIFVNPRGTKYTTLLELTDDEDEPDEYSVATYTVGYGFSGIVGTVRFSIEALNVSGEEIINEWHTKTYNTAVIDTLQGLRAIIPEPDGQVSTGITEEVKQALLQIARKVAYIDEHGQTYYDALYDALYAITAVILTPKSISLTSIGATSQLSARTVPEGGTVAWSSSNTNVATVDQNGLVTSVAFGSATITATSGGKSGTCSVLVAEATLTEISAVYTKRHTIYETSSYDDVKQDCVVTAYWSNGTTSTVASTDYTLSGTFTAGEQTFTASYGGMADTFVVEVASLTAVYAQYTQSGTVYDTDTLDSLKSDLYVYAAYSDMSTKDLADNEYTLSGTLEVGTSTITVNYTGLTTTFSVNVSDTSILNTDVVFTSTSTSQTLLSNFSYDNTKIYSIQYTFGNVSYASGTANSITGPATSADAVRAGAVIFLNADSKWVAQVGAQTLDISPSDGDILTFVLNFPSNRYYLYMNDTLLKNDTISDFYTASLDRVIAGRMNKNFTVAPVHIKIALGDLH